ncbi:hypothetical protein HRR78_003439 [Exophiala dermatitidis]|nr:hypothetical protein HRR75_000884 [Exophiala dermatitidis]KAJ4553180.1 hypothetical protein HRR78_003439 [Exophiala dermatitidis]
MDDSQLSGLGDDVHSQSSTEHPADRPGAAKPSTKNASNTQPTYEDVKQHEENLRRELDSVRQVNLAIEGVIQSLSKAKDNMRVVNNTVDAASTLLNTWTRILSQTEHNQRLILDPAWQGAIQDIADIEEEMLEQQRAAERRDAEAQEKKLAAARQAEAEEKRKAELQAKQAKGPSRGGSRIGSTGRGTRAPSSGYVPVGGTGTSSSASSVRRGTGSVRRSSSGIGRGGVAGRGSRARG